MRHHIEKSYILVNICWFKDTMLVNFLKLNDDKTEFLVYSSKHLFSKIDHKCLNLK